MRSNKFAIARAVAVIGSTLALVGGVTFANFTSTASLTDNNLSTASSALTISTDGTNFASTEPGFNVTDYVPGTTISAPFHLRNEGGVDLAVTVNVPSLGSEAGIVDNAQVPVVVTDNNNANATVFNTTLAALLAGQVPTGVTLTPNQTVDWTASLNIPSSNFTGSSANISNFNIVFTGTQP